MSRADALLHLMRAGDELLRAAAAALDASGGPHRAALRDALERERARWDARADDDPAAARVRDLCALLLRVLDDGRI